MKIVLLSSITGQDIRSCAEALVSNSQGRLFCAQAQDRILTVEDRLIDAAIPFLRRYRQEPAAGFSLADVLVLPLEELSSACHIALKVSLDEIATQLSDSQTAESTVILPFHPVLYHQLTREFVTPYQAGEIRQIFDDASSHVAFIVSIHDDIYDIYRKLLAPGRLFASLTTRQRRLDSQNQPYRNREPLETFTNNSCFLTGAPWSLPRLNL